MQQLTEVGNNIVNDLSGRYKLSRNAVIHMLIAVNNGGNSMAQFNCPELGGSGQWMRGGMTMVGDMFNNGLKTTVNNLCSELANALANNQMFPTTPAGTPGSQHWWPGNLGSPFSSGSQNNIRYAIFPNRLAIELNGQVSVYNTLNNNIGGVSQQQGGNTSLTFNSQFGTLAVSSLPLISGPGLTPVSQTNVASSPWQKTAPIWQEQTTTNTPPRTNSSSSADTQTLLSLIEKLAQLRDAGALTEDEFNTKKRELLSRL